MEVILQNLTKTFPSRDRKTKGEVTAVSDFTFTIPDGKLIGLLGPSGCGKSTTLNLISGLIKPTGGRIFFGRADVTDLPPEHRGIGLVFQNYALYPHLTVRQNITFPLENLKGKDKLSKTQMQEKAMEAAKLVQIDELMDRKPGELSGGQQQRVAIARALVKRPKVLLLDEPLSNLDARLRLATREEIRRIQRETGITTIFVTHDQEEAMSISDQIVVMKDGVVQQIGKPQEVYDNPANLFVAKFLGTPPINVFDANVSNGKLYIGQDAVLEVAVSKEMTDVSCNGKTEMCGGGEGLAAGTRGGRTPGAGAVKLSGITEKPGYETKEVCADGVPERAVREGSKTGEDSERKVYAAVRPEGFLLREDGPLCCELAGVEVMGRDISVVSRNRASQNKTIRAIIGAENAERISAEEAVGRKDNCVRFALIPRKVFLFDWNTQERISFDGKG